MTLIPIIPINPDILQNLDFINEIYLNPDKPDIPQNLDFVNKIDLNPDIPDTF